MQSKRLSVVIALAVVATMLLARCGKLPTSTTPASGTFGNVYVTVLQPACVQCHAPGETATVAHNSTLDFSTQATAYASLLAETAKSSGSACNAVKIVSAGNPSSSFLAGVLFSSYNINNFAGATGCQPYSAHLQDQHISADEQTSIISWIQNGAANN